ncbi:MAG: hypothetical protein SF123_26620 [Chloroflexota bacterium]|nr:hypothetical protein [Chloroflexota bacterium]
MLTIHLNTDWTCEYFEIEPDLYEFQEYGERIARLADWQFAPRYPEGWAAWLEKRFNLTPLDECVHYELRIEAVPTGAQLSVNGRQFGAVAAPATYDITDYVTLDDNRLAFRVESGADGAFGAVRLAAIPCE